MVAAIFLPFAYSWRNLLARKVGTAVTLAGVSVSVMVYVVINATADGIARVAVGTGEPANVVVLSKGTGSAERSVLEPAVVNVVRYLPGVALDGRGGTLASVELVTMESIPRKGSHPSDASNSRFTSIRGVTPQAFDVHSRVRLVAGRMPREPGEVLMGRLVRAKLGGVGIGDELAFGPGRHRISGIFEAEGQIFESEIWAPLAQLQAELGRTDVSQVVLRLESPWIVPDVLAELESSKRVSVTVKAEREYYERIQRGSSAFSYLGNLIGVIMGLGAVVAGMNTLFAAMSRRIREMGTLRALGYGRHSVGASLLLESVLMGALGGALGVALASAFDGFALDLMGLTFELEVGTRGALRGFALGCAIGVIGGFFPARAASRLAIVDALRHA